MIWTRLAYSNRMIISDYEFDQFGIQFASSSKEIDALRARRANVTRLYAEVSARIVAELEAGAAPWIKPWSATPDANTPCNAVSNRPYSGFNNDGLLWARAARYPVSWGRVAGAARREIFGH
jgi:antirestriction protein ArdC